MTPEQAKRILPFVQAVAEGKTIQRWRRMSPPDDSMNEGWSDLSKSESERLFLSDTYRIRAAPKFRRWTEEEVPLGALIRIKDDPIPRMIVGVKNGTLYLGDGSKYLIEDACAERCMWKYTYITSWSYCCVKVTE